MVRNGVEIEPVLQDITGEELNRGANTAPDVQLDIVARGFWERQRSASFDVRICHPNADSYSDMDLNQIYRQHETEKKRQYASRSLEVGQAIFTPLVFSTTGGIAVECKRYHSRLAELVATKKGENYATTVPWIRAKVSFSLPRSALLCSRGSRAKRRIHLELPDINFDIEKGHATTTTTTHNGLYLHDQKSILTMRILRTIFYFLLFIAFPVRNYVHHIKGTCKEYFET